jgi:coenzyme F420 hydrogenase subunit beta
MTSHDPAILPENAGAASLVRAAQPPVWSRTASPTLARVMAGELCAGCGMCAGIAPEKAAMQLSPEGFARPYAIGAALSADEEARVALACPGHIVAPWSDIAATAHPSWGPIRDCAEGHAVDAAVRFGGSSGGLLSALAIHALEAGLVDAVVHLAADPAQPTLNLMRLSTDRAGVMAAAGSRYGPSPVLADMERLLRDERRFLIIGKPCDISALRQLAKADARVDARFPWMLAFFCGGMPSIKGTEAIIETMGLGGSALARFRYRGNGWPGSARAEAVDGRAGEMSYADSWGRYLSGQVQYRCKICPDAVGGSADIAAADAWYGGESGYPQFDERDGRSLILVRSKAGVELLASALAAGACVAQPLAVGEIDLMQPSQARRKRLIVARTLAARLMMQPVPAMRGLQVGVAARSAGWGEQLRNLLGSLRRIVQNRR